MIDFEYYQKFVPTTAVYPEAGTGSALEVVYLGLGLIGEMQEWEEAPDDDREVGDVLWYIASLCNVYGTSMHSLWYGNNRAPYTRPNLAEALKKHLRDGKNIYAVIEAYMLWALSQIFNARIAEGDHYQWVLGYIQKAMTDNKVKLLSRQEKGTLQGDGNDR